ncbi:DUF1062 domain-containing protein [Ensifer sp. MJa1]|uniref:DUF1062 domain-containing protein n=1 Tax=Ensifer sp. MJa1 TaxID=2919888 RepID=UPI0030093876
MPHTLTVLWTIRARTAPRPWLACSRCRGQRPFVCSGKTRLNANGRRLDAWLIYRCTDCEDTWNRPIFERLNVRGIDPAMIEAFQNNEPDWIRRVAFDVEGLRKCTNRIEEFAECHVEKRVLAVPDGICARLEIVLNVALAASVRTDRLLSMELGLARARLSHLEAGGCLTVRPQVRKALTRPVRDGTRVVLDLSALEERDVIAGRAG